MHRRILVLTDGKAGHENQSKAFVRALGGVAEIAEVHFRCRLFKLLSYLFDWLGLKVPQLLKMQIPLGDYSAVVGTGSGTFYAVKTLAHRLGVKSGVVLYPRGYRLGGFDCILVPSFDRPQKATNTIVIPANLVATDEEFYQRGVSAFLRRYQPSRQSAVAVIVGGPNKCSTMTADWMKRQLQNVFEENPDCEFWVTTSRRTPAAVEEVVKSFAWDYALIYSQDKFNPIPAFVSLATRIYVTAESTGMLSEACTAGKAEVVVLDNLNENGGKFRRFVEDLKREGYVGGNRKIDLSEQFMAAKRLMGLG